MVVVLSGIVVFVVWAWRREIRSRTKRRV